MKLTMEEALKKIRREMGRGTENTQWLKELEAEGRLEILLQQVVMIANAFGTTERFQKELDRYQSGGSCVVSA